jgi:hypothetical protein
MVIRVLNLKLALNNSNICKLVLKKLNLHMTVLRSVRWDWTLKIQILGSSYKWTCVHSNEVASPLGAVGKIEMAEI